MEKIMKNKKILIIIVIAIIFILIGGMFLITRNNLNQNNNSQEKIYSMYVKINPLIKLTFKETEYKCDDQSGTKDICTKVEGITGYELLNDDAKDIYKDIDFKDKDVYEIVGMLCKIARDNEIAFKSIDITTDYKFNYDDFVTEIKNNSKYEVDYEITLDIKELIDEEEIINADLESNPDIKRYTITFDSDGGSTITKQVIKENEKVSKPKDPTKDGYTFVEWQLDGKKFDFNKEIKEDTTLKAKWQKETETTTKPNDNTKPQTDTKVKSTPDNINLNDNILVYVPDGTSYDSSKRLITTNAKELLKGYESQYGELYTYYPPYFGVDYSEEMNNTWSEKIAQLVYDSAKAKKIKTEMQTYLSKQKGIINININDDPKDFKFSYEHLSLAPQNKDLDDFVNAYEKKYNNIFKEINNIFYQNGGVIIAGGAAGSIDDPVLLDEALCNKFNLTCGRW